MSIDELFMLHERIAATLSVKITAEKAALVDRLKRADMISFTEGGHWRQRRVERGRPLWIETAPVQLRAAAG